MTETVATRVPRQHTSPSRMAAVALIGFAWFVVGVALLHVLRPELPPASHMVSEYAVGRLGWIQTVNFLALATGSAALAVAVWRSALPVGPTAKALVTLFAATTYLSAAFETGSGSWQETVHELVGILGFLALMVAAFTAARSLRRADHSRISRVSLLWGIAMIVTFPLVPVLGETGMGIGQRLFIACAIGWLTSLALTLLPARTRAATPASWR